MIQIPKKIYQEMVEHAKADYPNEACGILAAPQGTLNAEPRVVTAFFSMKNLDNSSISYFMDPKEQLQIFKSMRQESLEMCGIFHSHVASEAAPSQKDIRLAFYPEVSYLIVSLTDLSSPKLRSYRIQDEKVTEESVQVI